MFNKRCHQDSERRPTEWEKLLTSHISDKGFISKIYKKISTTQQQQKITTQLKSGQKTNKDKIHTDTQDTRIYQRRHTNAQEVH